MSVRKTKGPALGLFLLLLSTFVPAGPASAAGLQALVGPGVFQPAPAVLITYDNSLSMDFTGGMWEVPAYPDVCEPDLYEYARTRNIIGIEALTGSFQGYCPLRIERSATWGTRDDTASIPHTRAGNEWQRRDGLLDVYGDLFYFGLATFDTELDYGLGASGDYSYGASYGTINLGIASALAPMGGLVSPLPPGWLPRTPGAVSAFRIHNNARLQETVRGIIPALGTPIAATMDDVQWVRHYDAGLRSDPFAECRNFVHVLVTDGQPYFDRCYSGGWTPGWMRCSEYRAAYSTALVETANLAAGEDCPQCPGGVAQYGVPSYVLAFATDSPNVADDLATAGGTCALFDVNGICVQRAFRAEAQAEVLFSLGTILNRQLEGDLSMAPPLISSLALGGEVGVVRFRAGAAISRSTPYWTGELVREARTCQTILVDGLEERALVAVAPLKFEEQFTPAFVPDRNIYTARLDVARTGASCLRPYCPVNSPGCYEIGAIPDPMYDGTLTGFGDGSGGIDRGGNAPNVLPVLGSPTCEGAEYDTCVAGCAGLTACEIECELFFGCGTNGFTNGPPACIGGYLTSCAHQCVVDALDSNGDGVVDASDGVSAAELTSVTDFCTCSCQEFLACGDCADPSLATVTPDLQMRYEIDDRLRSRRRLAGIRGNDDPLPYDVTLGTDFDVLETYPGSCLIPFDVATFVGSNLSTALYAETSIEAERTVRFVRGETLSAMAADNLMTDIFDVSTIALHDREPNAYLGDFYHSRMAMAGQPSPIDRTSPGWMDFVMEHGVLADVPRPVTLYIGGNDAMLHAFNAMTGEEMWGVIPPSFLPQISQTVVSHRLTLDGPVTVRDLRCYADATTEWWCTLVAVSYRGGGSGVMVLEVSDPENPKFLFEVTGQQLPELGMGYPAPLLGNIFVGDALQPVLTLSGGRPLGGPAMVIGDEIRGTHDGEMLVFLNALTGEVYRQFDPVSHPDLFATCGPVTGSPSGWSRERFTRIFAGTQNGCLLRADVSSSDPLQWTLDSIYQTQSPGEITHPPAISTRADGTLVIVFGHGNSDSFEHVNQQATLVSVSETRTFIEGDVANGVLGRFGLGEGVANWEILLQPGEFLTTPPVVADGVVYVATWGPDQVDPCSAGEPRLYGIHYLGDSTVAGNDAAAPHVVTIDSARILPMLKNPSYDPLDPESKELIPFFGSELLGAGSVVSSLSIVPVPSCDTFVTTVDGVTFEVPTGATDRQLIIDVITREPTDPSGGTNPPPGGGSPDETTLGMVQISQDLPPPAVTSFLMDWGVGAEVW